VIGDQDDPGAGTGFKGVIADVFIGTDDLTTDEEADLYKGIPPADTVNEYLLDEGRGTTAYDRGSGGNNGTLDSDAIWAWGSCRQPVLSLDRINDHAQSSAGVDILGDFTFVWVGKLKSTYAGYSILKHKFQVLGRIDANNYFQLLYHLTQDALMWWVTGQGTSVSAALGRTVEIDEYIVLIGTYTAAGVLKFYDNGSLTSSATGGDALVGGGGVAYIGSNQTPDHYDISKPLMIALIDGALTEYSRWLNNIFNLGLTI